MVEDGPRPDRRDDDDESVGYGRPPRHSRFQKGQSGNPTGRKKEDPLFPKRLGAKKLLEFIAEQSKEIITVTVDGKRFRMPRMEALLKSLTQNASKDPRMMKIYLDLLGKSEKYLPDKGMGAYDMSLLSDSELIALRDLLKKALPKKSE
jgi:hypothetical protein